MRKKASCWILAVSEAYEKCLIDFDKMGKQSWLMGPECKNATDAKMALQIMMGGQAALLAECLAFCEYTGVDEKVWFDVLDKGVMMNPLLRSGRQSNVQRRRKQPARGRKRCSNSTCSKKI